MGGSGEMPALFRDLKQRHIFVLKDICQYIRCFGGTDRMLATGESMHIANFEHVNCLATITIRE
jgi:hypothetical protein